LWCSGLLRNSSQRFCKGEDLVHGLSLCVSGPLYGLLIGTVFCVFLRLVHSSLEFLFSDLFALSNVSIQIYKHKTIGWQNGPLSGLQRFPMSLAFSDRNCINFDKVAQLSYDLMYSHPSVICAWAVISGFLPCCFSSSICFFHKKCILTLFVSKVMTLAFLTQKEMYLCSMLSSSILINLRLHAVAFYQEV
jgi:hypothetical protein